MDTPNTQPIIEIRNVSMCFNLASEKHWTSCPATFTAWWA